MDLATFWGLIDEAHASAKKSGAAGDVEVIADVLTDLLSEFKPREIVAAQEILDSLVAQAYTQRLWGTCALANGTPHGDSFEYFIGWLIAQGKATYTKVVADPDSLIDCVDGDDVDGVGWGDAGLECEDILTAAWFAYRSSTDEDMKLDETPELKLAGEEIDVKDAAVVSALYPRLYAAVEATQG